MATVNIKCADIIQQYSGASDFCEWIRKVELVAKLQKVKELESFVPLFLSGGAFAVYENLEADVKEDYAKLKDALTKAFSTHQLRAFEEFSSRRLQAEETIDVFVADLRRLSGLVAPGLPEEWIKCKVVSGLPEETKNQLVAACSVERMSLVEVVERVRVLANACGSSSTLSAVARIGNRKGNPQRTQHQRTCFRCGQVGRISRECSQPSIRRCFVCNDPSHLATACPQNASRAGAAKNE
jgi:hypothetical protein